MKRPDEQCDTSDSADTTAGGEEFVTWTPKRGPLFYAAVYLILLIIGLVIVLAVIEIFSRPTPIP